MYLPEMVAILSFMEVFVLFIEVFDCVLYFYILIRWHCGTSTTDKDEPKIVYPRSGAV